MKTIQLMVSTLMNCGFLLEEREEFDGWGRERLALSGGLAIGKDIAVVP